MVELGPFCHTPSLDLRNSSKFANNCAKFPLWGAWRSTKPQKGISQIPRTSGRGRAWPAAWPSVAGVARVTRRGRARGQTHVAQHRCIHLALGCLTLRDLIVFC